MAVFWLPESDPNIFPHPNLAEPGGLLAVSPDLSPERVVAAYQNGIFPWFEQDGGFYWYAPDPRWVLFPAELKVRKSMRSIFNQQKFRYTLDRAFPEVMRCCAAVPREGGQYGSWITRSFLDTYSALHEAGLAHSLEVWQGDELVGGLYGISMGRVFYGESMFALVPNASKAGFITLVRALEKQGFWLIDCQAQTPHLESLGARGIPREIFLDYMERNIYERVPRGKWAFDVEGKIEVTAVPPSEKGLAD